MIALGELRAANIARQVEWGMSSGIDLAYRANELAGEAGEACNVIKKLERERLGIRGSRATVQDLADEIADVVICADLVAHDVGEAWSDADFGRIDLAGSAMTLSTVGVDLALWVGMVCGQVQRRQSGSVERRPHYLGACLDGVIQACQLVAARAGFDLGEAVRAKFNATSEKVGLATRLRAPS